MALFLVAILLLWMTGISQAGPEFDFEDDLVADAAPGFVVSGSSRALTVNTDKHKGGTQSLLWEWDTKSTNTPGPTAKLSINLEGHDLSIKDDELKKGGFKFWMYHDPGDAETESTMKIVFKKSSSEESSAVHVNLDFKGWRALWIAYAEFFEGSGTTTTSTCANGEVPKNKNREGLGIDVINQVEFRITSTDADRLYIDLVKFVAKMSKQTRDMVVKQVASTTRTAAGEFTFYDEKDFWQRTLRWYQERPNRCTPGANPPTQNELDDIVKIENRLKNWYATDEQIRNLAFDSETLAAQERRTETVFKDFKNVRWKDLYGENIKSAEKLLPKVLENKPSLFAHLSDEGKDAQVTDPKTKFNLVFFEVLLPLAMKYNFRSRQNELPNANGKRTKETEGSARSGGDNGSCEDLTDDPELKKIAELLLYLEDQGWAAGSGIGTLAHEMNKSGAGFIHALFLLRGILNRRCQTLYRRLVKAMNWYTDFNEIYQTDDNYIYDGTTADRMRTILLYRLMVVVMGTDVNNRVRDMHCFKNWVNHILRVNKGLGGFVKPDYTASHHKTFYGSAYVPQASHNAALVQYLLDGTNFALDATAKGNLRKVLEVLRMTAVKYSTPNGICGRFPNYNRAVLAEMIPAYAYISCVHGSTKTCETVNEPKMFLRLAQPLEDPYLKAYLEKGKLTSAIHYWHTLGSLDILDRVKKAAGRANEEAERSPSGHWSKNYAGLSIHRRDDWSVAAKGFSRYVWDFEKADSQNVYGIFVSHGSLQISNSEAALKAYDVDNGWDWTRIPGATTVNLGLDNIRTDNARYYNPGKFAGGVGMVGADGDELRAQNGAFGMQFTKPTYEMKTNKGSPLNKMTFKFKKSYFFYGNLIVAVGSDIHLGGVDKKDKFYAQTTLFQDKLLDPSKSSTISIDGQDYDLRLLLKEWKSGASPSTVNLIDTHDNEYQVKTDAHTELNVKISDQDSRKSNGCPDKTKARYATAWIIHKPKKGKTGNTYEYAVLVNGRNRDLLSKYTVKNIQNNKAHAVHIWETNAAASQGAFAYSIFESINNNNFGPVKATDSPCMIMAKKVADALYLSISNPSLEFEEVTPTVSSRLEKTCSRVNRKDLDSKGCIPDIFSPSNSDDVRTKMMFCVKGREQDITVTLNCDFVQDDIEYVRIDGEKKSNIRKYARKIRAPKKAKFLKVVDGLTTEIKINNPRCSYVIA